MILPSLPTFLRFPPGLRPVLLLCALAFALPSEMHAQFDRGNPEDEFAVELPVFGRMIGTITTIKSAGWGEEYGRELWAVGSVNDDTLQDWVISRLRCDTLITIPPYVNRFAKEILLYKGVPGGLPTVESGQRIGPSELGAKTTFIAAGDWDGDGHSDIAASFTIYGDTAWGVTNGGSTYTLAVFWGNATGTFTLDDTTRLSCAGPTWPGGGWPETDAAISGDVDGDGVTDLLTWGWGTRTIVDGIITSIPKMYLFKGTHGQRWGRNGVPRTASWFWWNPPVAITHISFTDQDCNGRGDICMFNNERNDTVSIGVLYGRDGLPDTTDFELLFTGPVQGEFGLFSDVTGDGVADLVLNTGLNKHILIYAGRPGQRLLEQFGSGDDPASPRNPHWRKPWARILLPDRIHDGWSPAGFQPLYDLGDIHGRGAGNAASEVWTLSVPFMIGYTGGLYMDSLIDATFDIRPGNVIGGAARLGDIDGSGVPTIAVQYDQIPHAGTHAFPGGVAFIKIHEWVPWTSGVTRHLPHIPGEACAKISSVAPAGAGEREFGVAVQPVPSSDQVRLVWDPEGLTGEVELSLGDALGAVVLRQSWPASAGEGMIAVAALARGTYFGTVRAGAARRVVRIVVP